MRVQVQNNTSFTAMNSSGLAPDSNKITFENIILEPSENNSVRQTFIFNLASFEVLFENSIIRGFNSSVQSILLNYANFRFLNSQLHDCYNFSIIYQTPSLTAANVYTTFQDSVIENMTGLVFFEANDVIQLQLYNVSIRNITQDILQETKTSWIFMKELSSVDFRETTVTDSVFSFLQISLVSGGYLRSNLTSMSFANIDLYYHQALLKIYGTWNTLISNTSFTNITNTKTLMALENVNAFSSTNLIFTNITSSSGDFQIFENIKLIGLLVSTFSSSVSFTSCSFSNVNSPSIYSQNSRFTIEDSTFTNTEEPNYIASRRYSSLLITESGPLFLDNVIFSGFKGVNGAIMSTLGYPAISEKSNFTNCIFTNNLAENFGGVIYSENLQSINIIQNCTFVNNSANSGGVIYINPQQLNFYYVMGNYSIEIVNSTFQNNTASNKGGAIFAKDFISISQSIFLQNKAMYGGAIYRSLPLQQNINETQDQIVDCRFENNYATFQGGAFLIMSKKKYSFLSNLQFNGNIAQIYNDFFVGLPDSVKFSVYNSNKQLRQLESISQIDSYKTTQIFSSTSLDEISLFNIKQNSGSKLPQIIELTVLDEEENIYLGVDGDIVNLAMENCYQETTIGSFQPLRGETSLFFQQGRLLIYDQVELFGNSTSNCSFQMKTNLGSSPTLQETSFQINTKFKVSFNACKYGEVFDRKLQICQLCKPGTYSVEDPTKATNCKACPFDKASCIGGNRLIIKPGFWRRDEFSDEILECPDGSIACLGSFYRGNYNPSGYCEELRKGGLCDQCVEGYIRIDDPSDCINCSDDKVYYFRYVGLLIVQVIAIIVCVRLNTSKNLEVTNESTQFESIKKTTSTRAMLMKIHLNFLQSLSLITRYKLKWPQRFNILPIILSETVPSHENALVSKCLIDLIFGEIWNQYFIQLIAIALLPLVFWLIYILLFLLSQRFALKESHPCHLAKENIRKAFMTIAFIFQPIILQDGLRTFDCISLPEKEENKTYMREDHSIECGSPEFYSLAFGINVPILVVWGLLLPLAFFYKAFKRHPERRRTFFFLLSSNGKSERFVWDYIIYGGKLLLIIIFVFFRSISLNIQVLLTFLIMLILLYLQIQYKPYRDPKLNKLETLTFLILIFYVYSGLFFLKNEDLGSWDLIFLMVLIILIIVYFGYFGVMMTTSRNKKIHPIKPENQETIIDQKDSQRTLLTSCSLKTRENIGSKSKKGISLKNYIHENDIQTPVANLQSEQGFVFTEVLSGKTNSKIQFLKDIEVSDIEHNQWSLKKNNNT